MCAQKRQNVVILRNFFREKWKWLVRTKVGVGSERTNIQIRWKFHTTPGQKLCVKTMDRQQRDGRNAGLGYSRRFEKSLISSGTLERERGEDSFTLQNLYFPFKLTATISALKIVEGCLLIGLGAAALGKTSNKKKSIYGYFRKGRHT